VRDDPDVSIITPTFNSSRFIDDTINSVLMQTFSNWELILIDDGSTDMTIERLLKWQAADDRIKILQNKKNLGPGPTRNRGVKSSRGRYVAYLDSDDIWLPNKLEIQLEHMQRHNTVFSYTSYETIDDQGKLLGRQILAPPTVSYEDLLKNTIIGCLTVMIDTKKAPPLVMPALPSRQPLVLWLKILRECGPAHGLSEILARYRVRAGSISSNKILAARQVWRVYRDYEHLSLPKAIHFFLSYALRSSFRNLGLNRK